MMTNTAAVSKDLGNVVLTSTGHLQANAPCARIAIAGMVIHFLACSLSSLQLVVELLHGVYEQYSARTDENILLLA